MAKFKIYEVKRVRIEEKDDYENAFLYANYPDAVEKFKELVEEEQRIDWIEECIALGVDNDEHREIDIIEGINFWGVYVDDFFTTWKSEVSIQEREVM